MKWASPSDLAGVFDEDLAGLEGDGFDGAILEVDEAGRDEEEEEDQRHHDVVVEAATLVGPPEVAFEDVRHSDLFPLSTLPHPSPRGISCGEVVCFVRFRGPMGGPN